MANGDGQQVQLPPGYEDAKPVTGPNVTQNASSSPSGISLPPGYEDAKPIAGPNAPPPPSAAPTKSRGQRIWDSILHPATTGASSINLGSQGGDAPQSLPANSQPGTIEQGAEKGLTATMGGISGHLGGPSAEPQETSPSTSSEWTGYALEGLAEFYAGDSAFKALGAADKLKKLQTVAQAIEDHPMLAKLVAVGTKAMRTGTVAGIQTFAKGGTPTESVAAGGAVAAGSAALDAVAPVAKYLNPFRKTAQQVATSAIQDAAGVGADTPIIKGATSAMDEPVQGLWKDKVAAYKKIDDTVGFDLKEARDQLKTDEYNLKQPPASAPAAKAQLQSHIAELNTKIADAETTLKAANIDPKSGDAANVKWQASRAFKNIVVRNTATDGTINMDTLLKQSKMLRFNKFGDRLAQFMGSPEKADAYMQQLEAAQKDGVKTANAQKIAKWTAEIIGGAAVGGTAFEGARKAWGAIFGTGH